MKYLLQATLIATLGIGGLVYAKQHIPAAHADDRLAAGEWKIEVQTPPCESEKNLQVIWPKESGAPLTIECDLMPVPEK